MSNLLNKILRLNYDLPELEGLDEYWLNEPFAKVVIRGDEYIVLEPPLSDEERRLLEKVRLELRNELFLKDVLQLLDKEKILFNEMMKRLRGVSIETVGKIWYYLRRDSIGYGKIDPILRDRYIEDISCSGYELPVYVYHRAYGSLRTNITFSRDELDDFVLKLAQKANVQLSLENPIADSILPTGERIQLTFRDVVSTRGSSFSIRKSAEEPITPIDLIAWGTATPEVMAFLWLCVEAKKNVLIIGPTASGKTTLLNAISMFIPKNAKIVSIEDTRELKLPHENWIPFLAKDFDEMFELLKASLRQRPEYILLGEIRGREAVILFQAMSTGHASYATLHAGDVKSAINRLIHDPINVPSAMFDALDYVVVLHMMWKGGRVVRSIRGIYEVYVEGEIKARTVWDGKLCTSTFENFDCIGTVDEVRREHARRSEFLKNLTPFRPKMQDFVGRIYEFVRGSN